MFNVTRSHLAAYSKNCSALKADWGPYFRFADDDYGSIRGYPEGVPEDFKNTREEYDEYDVDVGAVDDDARKSRAPTISP